LDDLKKMRSRAPFRPFKVHLTNGDILAVEHPENMSAPDDQDDLFVIWTKGDWNLIEAGQVARVSIARKKDPAR
jgi:hypothetical protein